MSKLPSLPIAPVAKKIPLRIETHGDVRIDDYFWLREKENPEVISLLNAENAYTEQVLSPLSGLREQLYEEMKARVKEDDSEVPTKEDEWFYYSRMEQGWQYAIQCRKRGSLEAKEEILLDGNELAKGKAYFRLGAFEISSDHTWLAYAVDFNGSEHYEIYFKNLATGETLNETIPDTAASVEWAEGQQAIFYTMLDKHDRPDRVYRHSLGEDPKQDKLVFQETDAKLFVSIAKTRSKAYLLITIGGKVTSEVRYLEASKPSEAFKILEPRREGVLYEVTHHGERFFIVTNDQVQNFRLVEAPTASPGAAHWREIRRGSPTLFIESAEAFKSHLVTRERIGGLEQIRVTDLNDQSEHLIEFKEPVYTLGGQSNPEFKTETYRFSYSSLVTPNTVLDYNMKTRAREVKKVQEIPSGYDPTLYKSERIFATAPDGVKVPVSLVYRVDREPGRTGELPLQPERKPKPLYLYGYGSYGLSMDGSFSIRRLSLLDRGFVFAIAHIRGGSEMGRNWYDDGKFLKKKNTFTDFIACAEHLIKEGYTRQGEIAIAGGSAGGMLMGEVINLRPELFRACAAHVPFVDVLNTMLDETLPLTPTEFEEWGNPKDPIYYNYIKSYSPYDNVAPKAYPHLLVTSGLNDPRVTYWEPAKWVAKLREMKTDQNLLLQVIHMGAGHGGPSGRYAALKEVALEYAFILQVFGKV